MELGIRGEAALVVGASEGIGYACAKGLLDQLACAMSRRLAGARGHHARAWLQKDEGERVPPMARCGAP